MSKLVKILGLGTALGLGCLSNSLQTIIAEHSSSNTMQSTKAQRPYVSATDTHRSKGRVKMSEAANFEYIEQLKADIAYLKAQTEKVASETMKDYDKRREDEHKLILDVHQKCFEAIYKFNNQAGINMDAEYVWFVGPNTKNPALAEPVAKLMNNVNEAYLYEDYQFTPNAEQ